MPIIREQIQERILGESKALNIDKDGALELPTSAVNFQEVKHNVEASIEYPIVSTYENDFFNLNPFFMKPRFKWGTAFLEEQLSIANYWMQTAQTPKTIFAPEFSSEIQMPSRQADFTTIISMYSDASYVTIPEHPSLSGTQRAIDFWKKEMKKEGVEKEILLQLSIDQDELLYASKYQLAERLGLHGRIINWNAIGVRWRNMELLANDYNSKMIRIVNNIPRAYKIRNAYLPTTILLGDVVSHAPILGHGNNKPKGQKVLTESQKKKIASVNASTYYPSNNGMYRQSDYKKESLSATNCKCEPHQYAGETEEDFFATFYNDLNKVTEIHNTITMHKAIKDMRKFIGNGLGTTLNNMRYARNVLENIYSINPNQMRL